MNTPLDAVWYQIPSSPILFEVSHVCHKINGNVCTDNLAYDVSELPLTLQAEKDPALFPIYSLSSYRFEWEWLFPIITHE